jgi:hypothetical protein
MSSINNLVPLEYNPILEGGAITDYWWVGIILIVVLIIVISAMSSGSSDDNDQSTSVKQSSNMQMGVRTNDNGEKEYYKIVDGEEQPLSEEDIKNLEAAQNSTKNIEADVKSEVNSTISGLDIDDIVAKSTAEVTASTTVNNSA